MERTEPWLRMIPIFADLEEAELNELGHGVRVRRVKKGAIIFVEGEPGDGVYFLHSGKVKIYKLMEDGREKILHFVNPGDVFAEILLFDEGNFPASAAALENSEIAVINNAEMRRILAANPQLAWRMLGIMSRRLRQAFIQVRDLAYRDVHSRLAAVLKDLAAEYGRSTDRGVRIELALSQQELANLVGASRETVARALSQFKKSGCLDTDQRYICVTDMEALEEWAEMA